MDRMLGPSSGLRAHWRGRHTWSWHFPALVVLGGALIAACSSGSKNGNQVDPATALSLLTAPPTTFAARAVITPAPVVQLVDNDGDPVADAGVAVTVTLSSGTGTLQGTTSVSTNADGQATFANLSIVGLVGVKGLTFSAAGLTSAQAPGLALTAGPASTIAANSVTAQLALTNTAVAILPSVLVTDLDANPVAAVAVSFAVTAGGGIIGGPAQTTNASGVATLGSWTTGAAAGVNTVQASSGGLNGSPVSFNVTAGQPGVAAAMELQTAPPGTVAARATLTPAPVVQVVDVVGDPVDTTGVDITVTLVGGGTLNGGPTVATDAAGQATFAGLNIAGLVGTRTLQFAAAGLPNVVSGNIVLTPGPAANLAANSTTNQTATAGTAVAAPPSVKATDLDGNAVAGVAVTFAITVGTGALSGANPNTNASGIATLTSWTLGSGANTVEGSAGGLNGSPVSFTATGTPPVSNYTITLQYATAASPAQQAAFDNAKARWEQIVTGDVPDITIPPGAPFCTTVVAGPVDDVLIVVRLEPIDGPGMILGQAGPCLVRSGSRIPLTGEMTFDTADLAALEASGSLGDVILHEMMHVLGYGSLWGPAPNFNLVAGPCTTTPLYTGSQAIAAFTGSNGGSGTTIPLENFPGTPPACPNGTRDSHWEEDVFRSELMTGFISGTIRPISLTSVRSLVDMGYAVNNSQADPFNINTQPTLRAGEVEPAAWHMVDDLIKTPLYEIDASGRVRMIRPARQ